jgi:hypothetical protein
MGTAITWMISFFLVSGTAFTAVTMVITSSAERTEANTDSHARLINEMESSFKLVSVSDSAGRTLINLIITNDGRSDFSNFEDWVVTIRYDQDGGSDETYLVPAYTDSLADNTWTAFQFWLDYGASQAEVIEPGILNPHEEMEVRIQINPVLEAGTDVVITLTSPQGVTESITFEA